MRLNPWWRMLDSIVTEVEAAGRRPTTHECKAILSEMLLDSIGVSIRQTVFAFAAHQVDGYFGQKARGHRVWELWNVTDDEGYEHRCWVRRADLTAHGVDRVLRFNRRVEIFVHGANTRRESDRDALLMHDPTGEQLRLGEFEASQE